MLYDLDIRREEALSEVSNTTFKNYNVERTILEGIELEEEDYVDDENQVKYTKRRKEKKVLRLSHISEYEKLPDLMIGEDRNLSSTRNTGDIEVFSDNLSNPDSIYPASPLPYSPDRNSQSSARPSNAQIIEISSDSDSNISLQSTNRKEIITYLMQQYSNNFACSQHLPISSCTTTTPLSWSLARITQLFDQNLPVDYPEPGKFGYGGKITSQQWLSLLCGISTTNSLPPVLEIPTQDHSSTSTTTYDIDSFIAKVKCLSVAKKGLRVQFSPSCLRNISTDVHLYSKIEERLLSGNIKICQVPLHHIPHFYLGHLASSLHLPLYVFLPALWNSNLNKN
ncbi:hypothetical protein L873DRAFT_649100 [Choiromyces venosus 120613-1]|uniref:Uncharacterized protein n=1 Tax=Choiromyces venosus 120613-1 TaxID=1336337 RepID=A0A3N4ITK4_9PEZI|nr:hypothetical protein L873DRAFT_649100 [Choiromyces venosus 120613-1]